MRFMLRVYCVIVMSQITMMEKVDRTGVAVDKIRINVLENLKKDIRDKRKKGQIKQAIFNFYWDESFFRQLWAKLGLTREQLLNITTK